MLARLTQIPGVSRAEVERAGRTFRLTLVDGVTFASLRASLSEILGDCLEVFEAGDAAWYAVESITELSLLEAELLSARWGDLAATAAGLDESLRATLRLLLREQLAREFLRVHDAGSAVTGWYREAFPRVFEGVFSVMGASLTEAQRNVIREALLIALSGV